MGLNLTGQLSPLQTIRKDTFEHLLPPPFRQIQGPRTLKKSHYLPVEPRSTSSQNAIHPFGSLATPVPACWGGSQSHAAKISLLKLREMFCFNINRKSVTKISDANRIVTDEKADSCQWDRASTLNDKLQHPLPRFPPNALVVHISIAATRTLDDYRKGKGILNSSYVGIP